MNSLVDHPAETAIDAVASAILAAAIAYSASAIGGIAPTPLSVVAFLSSFLLLRGVKPSEAGFVLARFEREEIADEPEELILSAADILAKPDEVADELVLDDVLARIGPESRVVRLFAPDCMPTAGELRASIDRHLGMASTASDIPDASRALTDALAELRRSLR